MCRRLFTALALALVLWPASAQTPDWRTALHETFDAGGLDTSVWSTLPVGGAAPIFEPRGAGWAIHARAQPGNAGLELRQALSQPYRLAFDFRQPAEEAGGYRLVVSHARAEGTAWWFEFDRNALAVWTTVAGSWATRWSAEGLRPDTWYHVVVSDEPERVRLALTAENGTPVAASDWLAHDLGSAGHLSFRADSGDTLRGAQFDEIDLALPAGAATRGTAGVDRALESAREAAPTAARATCVVTTRDGLALDLDADGATRAVRLDGQALPRLAAEPGGFYAWDITEAPRYERFASRGDRAPSPVLDLACEALGLTLRGSLEGGDDRLVVTGELADTRGVDRAVVVSWVLPIDAAGWQWGDDLNHARAVAEEGRYQHAFGYGLSGANGGHLMSVYPWSALTRGRTGLMLARPLDWPRLSSTDYDHSARRRALVVRFDLGLSARTRRFPSRASFRFVLSRVPEADWGFRAAAQRYYDLYPQFFARRVDREGLWHLWVNPVVPQPEELGLVFHEQEPFSEDRVAFDDVHGGLSFTYAEPSTLWQHTGAFDQGRLRLPDLLADLLRRAAQPVTVLTDYPFSTQPVGLPDAELAQAALNSYIGGEGEPSVYAAPPDRVAVNCAGDPELPRPSRASLWFDHEGQRALGDPRVDGAYLDSLCWGTFDTAEDARAEHWATADIPLIASFRTGAPAQLGAFSHYELYTAIADAMHQRGKLVQANTFPFCHIFYAHLLDAIGVGEGGDLESFHDAERLSYCRALAYRKPLSHMNYAYLLPEVSTADKERAIARNLPYAVWPGTGNGADLARLEAFRPLMRRYAPLLRDLSAAGWEPVTLAKATPGGLVCERYGRERGGPLYLVVHNPSAAPCRARLTWDARLTDVASRLVDRVSGQALPAAGRSAALSLAPWQTAMLVLRR